MKMLHHKNTPTFHYLIISLIVVASLSVNELLTVEKNDNSVTNLLFPKVKNHLKDRYFHRIENIQKVVIDYLNAVQHRNIRYCSKERGKHFHPCTAF